MSGHNTICNAVFKNRRPAHAASPPRLTCVKTWNRHTLVDLSSHLYIRVQRILHREWTSATSSASRTPSWQPRAEKVNETITNNHIYINHSHTPQPLRKKTHNTTSPLRLRDTRLRLPSPPTSPPSNTLSPSPPPTSAPHAVLKPDTCIAT
jgi:hypothetical protein